MKKASYHNPSLEGEDNCPNCGYNIENTIPDNAGIEDEAYYYDFTCPNCRTEFTQLYDLVWVENITQDPAVGP